MPVPRLPKVPYVLSGAIAVAALLLMWLVLGVVLSRGKELDARHEPRAWEPFDFERGSWADYSAWAERQLRTMHTQETLPHALAPYRLDPAASCPAAPDGRAANGVVLMHDALESPYMFRELALYLQRRCFLVLVPLLPGHGTQPGDLLQANWQDWQAVQRFAARVLRSEVQNLFLGGHGTGGTLALLEAAGNADVDGLLLFAPLLRTQAQPWYARVPGLQRVFAASAWARVLPDETAYRYESVPLALRPQQNALIDATRALLPGSTASLPVFAVASTDDAEADAGAILEYMSGVVHAGKRTLLYSSSQFPADPGIAVALTNQPERGLLSLGHEALLLPLGNDTFGQNGSFADCGHYFGDADTWQRCRAGPADFYGEPGPETLERGLLRKPTYNFLYSELRTQLDAFLAPLGATSAAPTL